MNRERESESTQKNQVGGFFKSLFFTYKIKIIGLKQVHKTVLQFSICFFESVPVYIWLYFEQARIADDVKRKIDVLESAWKTGKLSEAVQQRMARLSQG